MRKRASWPGDRDADYGDDGNVYVHEKEDLALRRQDRHQSYRHVEECVHTDAKGDRRYRHFRFVQYPSQEDVIVAVAHVGEIDGEDERKWVDQE